ncbi:MAG: hypothetical protein FD160_1761 [Caulobacteraceae bacterium]|nr:MAG: hypothetical protein FD160_1761 [Caulobacteraceae bacterium]
MIRAAFLATAALFAASALAQDSAPPPPSLYALPPAAGGVAESERDAADQALAMMGREDRIPPETRQTCANAEGAAIESIVLRAREARVVIINEAHEQPRNRAFIEDLAAALHAAGYKTYASDSLARSAARDEPVHARITDGDFTAEPTSGALLSALRTLGYRIVPFEASNAPPAGRHFTDQINARETAYASSLINRTIQTGDGSKVLVHVGFGRNRETLERIDRRNVRWMALQLREITGIDPLTIDQTSYVSDRTGVCAFNSDGSALPTDRDIYVAHPPLAFERERPTWRLARGQRFADIPRALKNADERVIYEARYANEPDDAVPADRILVDPGEDIPLLLAPGRYRVRAWTQDGAWTRSMPLTVAASTPPAPQKARPKSTRRKKK